MRGLTGRVAIVTGATGLIGSAICHRLAAEGAKVVVASRCLGKANKWIAHQASQYTTNFVPVELNLADERSIGCALERLSEQVKNPTILIANASLRGGLTIPFAQLSHNNFNRLLKVDVAGHFLCGPC